MKRQLTILFLGLALIGTASCMSVKATPLGEVRYPPNPSRDLPVYTSMPEGNWAEVVRLRIDGTTLDKSAGVLKKATIEAAEFGAHAVVILNEGVNRSLVPNNKTGELQTEETPFGVFVGIRDMDR